MKDINKATAFEKVRYGLSQRPVTVEQEDSLSDFNIELIPSNRWDAMILLSAARLYRGTNLPMGGGK